MNPDQTTPPSSSSWNDNSRSRRDTYSYTSEPTGNYPWYNSRSTTPKTTRTGTYGLGISPPPSLPGETETTTPGQNCPIPDPVTYQTMGRYRIPTPSTSWTGINPWPWSNNPSMHRPRTNAAPQLGRAPWPGLINVLEDRTQSLSPPPVKLSVYHPLQTTTQHRLPTPIPSSNETSPSRFESAPTSPTTSIPKRINEPRERSSSNTSGEKRTLSTPTAPFSSGPNSPPWIKKSSEKHESLHGRYNDLMSRTEPPTTSQDHES